MLVAVPPPNPASAPANPASPSNPTSATTNPTSPSVEDSYEAPAPAAAPSTPISYEEIQVTPKSTIVPVEYCIVVGSKFTNNFSSANT